MLKKVLFAITCISLAACSNKNNEDADMLAEEAMQVKKAASENLDISAEAMEDIIQSIPSPIETSVLIKESGVEFDNKMLNPTENMDKYNVNLEKALNLGIYGADLGYINIYEKTYAALNYLNVIKQLADDLKVGQFFDFGTLKRLATNSKNIDSLLYISTSSLNKMDGYLRDQKRGNLSVLMISGAWLEGLHIATQVVKNKPVKEIYERIGEQKMILDNLMLILSVYKSDPYFADIVAEFELIKKQFDKVSITYVYAEPESKEVNGQLVIVDKSTTQINITEADVKNITAVIEQTRNKLIN
jgi:hypothetical protein